MAEVRYHLPFNKTANQKRKITVGLTPEVNSGAKIWGNAPHLAQLRVGFLHPELVAERWTAEISVNEIGPIGPIDLPFTLNVEQPATVTVTPLSAPTDDNQVELLLCDLPNPPNYDGATYLVTGDPGTVIVIPHWVVAVTVFGDPTAVGGAYYDPSATLITAFLGPERTPRPRIAQSFQFTGTSGAALFHY